MKRHQQIFLLGAIFSAFLIFSGCGAVSSAVKTVTGAAGLDETGTVIAKHAQIRSSYAVVAADLLEVKRGDTLDILDEYQFEKLDWLRVRAHDEDQTEGWIESQNVIKSEDLDKSRQLADEIKDSQAQANGQLRAVSNLRLTPEQNDSNILLKLDNGSTFEIVNWKFVPKIQEAPDVDDSTNASQKSSVKGKNAEIEAAKDKNEPEKMDEKYDIWYQVRLDPSQSPAPVGWLFGRQVELQVPSEISFYQQNNKKFVTWQRLDNLDATEKLAGSSDITITKPSSWVILWRTNDSKPIDGIEPDFDGIYVLAYDKYNQEHYSAYRAENVWGRLPLKVEGSGDNKSFTVQLRGTNGKLEEKRFTVVKTGNRLKVNPPPDIMMK